jgi:hypothetical protein
MSNSNAQLDASGEMTRESLAQLKALVEQALAIADRTPNLADIGARLHDLIRDVSTRLD